MTNLFKPFLTQAENNLNKQSFKHIKIFNTGNFNGINHTLEHLQDAVQAQQDFKDKFLPGLKFTHEDTKSLRDEKYKALANLPFILGSTDNFTLEGNSIFCDFIEIFPAIEKALQDKLIKTHSVEAYYNIKFKESNKTYKMMITAVSFLPVKEIPALVEVFKPYMYNLDSNNTDMENNENLQPVTVQLKDFNIDDFSYEKKLIYKIGEKRTMDKLVYENMMKPFQAKGVQCMGYDEFIAMTPEQQAAYVAEIAAKLEEILNAVKNEEGSEMVKSSFSLKDIEGVFSKMLDANLTASKFSQKINDVANQQIKANETLEKNYEALITKMKRDEVTAFVHKFSKSATPSLPIANEEMAIELLMAVSDDKKTNFSVNNNKLGLETLVKNFISSLPVIESKTTREVFKTNDGIVINDVIRSQYLPDETDEDIALDLKVQKYSLEKNVSYEKAYEIIQATKA